MTPSTSTHTVSDWILGLLRSGAFVAALFNIFLARRRSLEDERARVRTTCAEAFEAVAAYKEFPYAVRRRADTGSDERIRLPIELRTIQQRLSYYTAWMRGEDARLGAAYDTLVTNLRRIAGIAIHDAWIADPIDSDAAMNIPPSDVDLSAINKYEEAYIAAVKEYLDGLIEIRRLLGRRSPGCQ